MNAESNLLTVGGQVVVGLLVDDKVDKVSWWDEASERILSDRSNHEHILYRRNTYTSLSSSASSSAAENDVSKSVL